MRIDVVTLFPELVASVLAYGVTARAARDRRLDLVTWNPREDAADRHSTVDDRPYGGGPGMVMAVEPLATTIRRARAATSSAGPVVYLSPQGRRVAQEEVRNLAGSERLILLCGRYEGVDERLVEQEVDDEISMGDFVVSGGEIPAMALIDAVARWLPGVLGHEASAAGDSFATGLLDWPHYTRPEVVNGQAVPAVLASGDHAAVARWRRKQALGRTWLRRPELLARQTLDAESRGLLREFINEYRGGDRGDSV